MTNVTTKLAVLGLGTMGRGMAGSALRAGIPTVVWNREPAPARAFADRGAEVATTPAGAVAAADVVITMVTDADAVVSIAVDLGMLAALRSGAVWAQMSTIGAEVTEKLAAMVGDRRPDISFLELRCRAARSRPNKERSPSSPPDPRRPVAGSSRCSLR